MNLKCLLMLMPKEPEKLMRIDSVRMPKCCLIVDYAASRAMLKASELIRIGSGRVPSVASRPEKKYRELDVLPNQRVTTGDQRQNPEMPHVFNVQGKVGCSCPRETMLRWEHPAIEEITQEKRATHHGIQR